MEPPPLPMMIRLTPSCKVRSLIAAIMSLGASDPELGQA